MTDTIKEQAAEAIRTGMVEYLADPVAWAEQAAPGLGNRAFLDRAAEQAGIATSLLVAGDRAIRREYCGGSLLVMKEPAKPAEWQDLGSALLAAERAAEAAERAIAAARDALERYRVALGEITPRPGLTHLRLPGRPGQQEITMDKLPVYIDSDDVRQPLVGSLGRAGTAEEAAAMISARLEELSDEPSPKAEAVERDVEVRANLRRHDVPRYRRLAAEHRGLHTGDFFVTEGHGGMILHLRCWVGQ